MSGILNAFVGGSYSSVVNAGEQSYTTAGTYCWVAPAGVTKISIVGIGGGRGGGGTQSGCYSYLNGGTGGSLSYLNCYTVVPGNTYQVVIGAGGTAGSGNNNGGLGGNTTFNSTALVARGGGQSTSNVGTASYTGGAGGTTARDSKRGGPGGGAGGYTANGGCSFQCQTSFTSAVRCGGGGGGGAVTGFVVNVAYSSSSSGGGVGLMGRGPNSNWAYQQYCCPPGRYYVSPAKGGSCGTNGAINTGPIYPNGAAGGTYGGGGSASTYRAGGYGCGGAGGRGAMRIIWGGTQVTTRAFPSTWTCTYPNGSASYLTPGTYAWVAPAGVTSVSVVAIGGGGNGLRSCDPCCCGGNGYGGALAYKNNYSVTPGTSYTVIVGAAASSSSFSSTSVLCAGGGGTYGPGAFNAGTAGYGGGTGYGQGAPGTYTQVQTTYFPPAGSGGAQSSSGSPQAPGGGIGVWGRGETPVSVLCNNGIFGGSGGMPARRQQGTAGGKWGGGGAGNVFASAGAGGTGAVRIIWPGNTRSFPATNAGNV